MAEELRRMSGQRYGSPMYEAHEQRSGWLMFTRAAATWDPVREDPRYLALLKRLRLDF